MPLAGHPHRASRTRERPTAAASAARGEIILILRRDGPTPVALVSEVARPIYVFSSPPLDSRN